LIQLNAKYLSKKIIKYLLNFFNLNIQKIQFLKFDKNFNLSKLNFLKLNIIKDYKITNLITLSGTRLGSNFDAYYRGLAMSAPIKNKEKFICLFKTNMKKLFNREKNASEILNDCNEKNLSSYPYWALVLPWDDISIKDNYNNYIKLFVRKRKKVKKIFYKYKNEDKYLLGDKIIHHDLSWESHAEQFYNLYNSIKCYGYLDTGIIPVNIFVYNNTYRLSLSFDGNHRIRVAHYLNIQTVPLKISRVIYYNDAKNWHNVKNGLYSAKNAQKIFLNYYNYRNNHFRI
jgi:hypothetical protein